MRRPVPPKSRLARPTGPSECGAEPLPLPARPRHVQVYRATLELKAVLGLLSHTLRTWFFTSAAVGIGTLMLMHMIALLLFALRPGGQHDDPPAAKAVIERDAEHGAGGRKEETVRQEVATGCVQLDLASR